ncbi:MAG: universal stress protein [Candidatus Hydrothermarchaeota archaeon]
MEGKRIIIAANNTDDSKSVTKQVGEWMGELRGRADPTVLYVVDEALIGRAALADDEYFDIGTRRDAVLEKAVRDGEAYLQELKGVYGGEGIEVETRLRLGNPAREIVREARESDAYAIVIGTHNRSSVSKALFGSITNEVIRAAPCPVIVFTPKLLRLTDRVKQGLSVRVRKFDAFLSGP